MKIKKLLAGILSAAMVLGTVTLPVFAEDGDTEEETGVACIYREEEDKTIFYDTLEAAIKGAEEGETVCLLQEYTVKEQIVVDKDINIDFANNKITVDHDEKYGSTPAFRILADVEVRGDDEVTVIDTSDGDSDNTNTRYCFTVGYAASANNEEYPNGKAGTLTVKNGVYKGDCSVISVNRGAAYITGGIFDVESWTLNDGDNDHYRYLLNCNDENYKAGLANIFVTGGKFTSNFDPANNSAEGKNTSFVPVGYNSSLFSSGEYYYVWPGSEDYHTFFENGDSWGCSFESALGVDLERDGKDYLKLNYSSTIASPVTIKQDCTIDLNGQTLYYAGTCEGGVIKIANGAKVTVKDSSAAQTGAIITADGDEERRKTPYVFTVGNDDSAGELTIENGFYKGDCSTVYVKNGTANIKGGEFDVEPWTDSNMNKDYRYMINCLDAAHKAGKANIVITGGKFKNYNPSASASESPIANFVANGCSITAEGDSFVVTAPAASIGTQNYATLEAAVAAATNGDTVKLEKDTKVADTVEIKDKKITLDLNGKTVGIEKENNLYYSTFYLSNADVTVTGNGTVDGVLMYNNEAGTATGNYAFGVNSNSTLTVKNGTFRAVSTNIHIWTGTVNIEGGEFFVTPYQADWGTRLLLNCDDSAYIAGSADFNVTGGKFHKFNPADSKGEPSGANFVADGYEALVEGDVYVVEKTQNTLVDSGWYYKDGAKRGVIRFSFKLNADNLGTITEAGIKYVKNTGDGIEDSTVKAEANEKSNSFYGDIKNIAEGDSGKYFAKAYITDGTTTVWSDLLEGSVNWSREFTGYEG